MKKRTVTLRKWSSHKMSMRSLSWWRLSKTIVSTKMSIHFKWICLPNKTREKILSPRDLERDNKDTINYQMKVKTLKLRHIKHLLKEAVLMTMIPTRPK